MSNRGDSLSSSVVMLPKIAASEGELMTVEAEVENLRARRHCPIGRRDLMDMKGEHLARRLVIIVLS